MQNDRNHSLDLFKGIACIAVVLVHVSFPGKAGLIISSIARFAVPFFFMVSGYYSYHSEGRRANRNKKHIMHMLKIILFSFIVYVPASFLFSFWGDTVNSTLHDVGSLDLKGIFIFFVFNRPVIIVGQLWFLFALLYDYVLFDLIERRWPIEKYYISIPILLTLLILLAQGMHIAGVAIPNYLYRNFLIEGFAFFLLAYYLHSVENKIHVSDFLLIIVFLLSTIGCVFERILLGRAFGVNICTIPQLLSIFLFSIKHSGFGWKTRFGRTLCSLGEKISLHIYIIHPFVWRFINWIYKFKIGSWQYMNWLKPILVLVLTVLISILFYQVKTIIHERRGAEKAV